MKNGNLPYNSINMNNSSRLTTDVNGKHTWTVLLFGILIVQLIVDNYARYGIVKGPIEIAFGLLEFWETNLWYFAIVIISVILQALLCYLIEIMLAKNILKERMGMTLHLVNALLSLNVCSVICLRYRINPFAGVIIMTHIFLINFKTWSFCYANQRYRKIQKKNAMHSEINMKKSSIEYPDNITLVNISQFLFCTASTIYSISPLKRRPRNLVLILKKTAMSVLIFYSCAFLLWQFIVPEARNVISYIDGKMYHRVFQSALRLAFPVNLLWLLFFYNYCFKIYLPMMNELGGTENVSVAHDWWNAENTTIFWTKWNYQMHICFKECIFLPLMEIGYSKRAAAVAVALVSGIFHEYLLSFPCQSSFGFPTVIMMLQIPLANVSTYCQKRFGNKWGNVFVWGTLIVGHVIGVIGMYYVYAKTL